MQREVLIIEDESSLRLAVKLKLSQSGYLVAEAKNGEEGLKYALSSRPDLIILDIIMPRMDGIDFLKELRKDQWGKTAKVIVLTNVDSSDDMVMNDITRLQPTYYFVKSNESLDKIVEAVDDTFNTMKS